MSAALKVTYWPTTGCKMIRCGGAFYFSSTVLFSDSGYNHFLFKVIVDRSVSFDDHDVTFTLKFPNAGDGIIEYTPETSSGRSALRLSHNAPAKGYTGELVQHYQREPGVPVIGKRGYPEFETNYVFRVRTRMDNNGNVIEGLYGKIHGPISLSNYVGGDDVRPTVSFNYYLNPNTNDTNIEYDPAQNLFKGVPHRLKVTAP